MRGKSKERLQLGEENWEKLQQEKQRKKARKWYRLKGSKTSIWRIRLKQKLIEYKGGKCQMCGYDKDVPGAYAFHHRNPEEKEFTISRYQGSLEKAKREADKCDLLCCNCHAEVHYLQRKDDKEEAEKESRVLREFLTKECFNCGTKFQTKRDDQKYCSQGCVVHKRKVQDRPSAILLSKLLETTTWTNIGGQYGVSDNAVRKWARSYGLI